MRHLLWFWLLPAILTVQAAWAMDIFVQSPREGEPVIGEAEVSVEVMSMEPITAVEIKLDGEVVARLTHAPYRATIDFGQENRPHTIEITATDITDSSMSRSVRTGMIQIDDAVDLELQQLYVTVTRGADRVLDLVSEDFRILDDRQRQTTVTFERGDIPLTAVLLIDSSLSMEGTALAAALAGASSFVEAMNELDEAQLMVFADRLLAQTPFIADPAEVGAVIDTVVPTGSTAINDHLYLALDRLESRQGRKVVVLLSDGLDVDSILRMADVEWKAGRVQAVIYWIRLSTGADPEKRHASVWRNAAAQRNEIDALESAVAASGGRQHVIARIEDASTAFGEILRELRAQYVLGYYPSDNRDDGAWHEVDVKVDSPGVKVRVRGGYYDDEF